jgi:hypothetical protein
MDTALHLAWHAAATASFDSWRQAGCCNARKEVVARRGQPLQPATNHAVCADAGRAAATCPRLQPYMQHKNTNRSPEQQTLMKNHKSVALLLHLHRQKSPSYFSPSSHEVMEEYLAHLYGYNSSTTSTVLSTIISPISI